MNTYLLRENGLLASVRRPFFNSRNVLNKRDHLQKLFSNVTWVVEFCSIGYKVTLKKRNFIGYKFDLKRQKILKPFIKGFQNVAKSYMVLVLNSHESTNSLW